MSYLFSLMSVMILNVMLVGNHQVGDIVDTYNGVTIYYNGPNYTHSDGLNFAKDGYCYGQKWQSLEFVNRYYDQVFHFRFKNSQGHARDYWNLLFGQGELNTDRGLLQYYNDDVEAPQVGDILVFPFSEYGHVCIVSKIENNQIEVVQQNIELKTRDFYTIAYKKGHYAVSNAAGMNKPIGWLRIPKK